METQGTQTTQKIFGKEESLRTHGSNFKTYYKPIINNQDSAVLT